MTPEQLSTAIVDVLTTLSDEGALTLPDGVPTGVTVERKPGERVAANEPVLTLYYNDAQRLDDAIQLAERAITIADAPPPGRPLVRAWVHADGEERFA